MKFEYFIKMVLEFCLKKFQNFHKEKVTTFSIELTVSALTERKQMPVAKRATTVASSLEESTRLSTYVQGNEVSLAYIKKATLLETMSTLMDRYEITAEYQR